MTTYLIVAVSVILSAILFLTFWHALSKVLEIMFKREVLYSPKNILGKRRKNKVEQKQREQERLSREEEAIFKELIKNFETQEKKEDNDKDSEDK